MSAIKEKHQLCIMNETGDLKVLWSDDNQDEVDAAKAQFDTMIKKGYLAYTVEKGGVKGVQVTKFDPSMEKIILSPPLRGG